MIFSLLLMRMQLNAISTELCGTCSITLISIFNAVVFAPTRGWNSMITHPEIVRGRLLLMARKIIPSDTSTACVNTR